jgi:hypothetical protein
LIDGVPSSPLRVINLIIAIIFMHKHHINSDEIMQRKHPFLLSKLSLFLSFSIFFKMMEMGSE